VVIESIVVQLPFGSGVLPTFSTTVSGKDVEPALIKKIILSPDATTTLGDINQSLFLIVPDSQLELAEAGAE
jgi:hypothetical protein